MKRNSVITTNSSYAPNEHDIPVYYDPLTNTYSNHNLCETTNLQEVPISLTYEIQLSGTRKKKRTALSKNLHDTDSLFDSSNLHEVPITTSTDYEDLIKKGHMHQKNRTPNKRIEVHIDNNDLPDKRFTGISKAYKDMGDPTYICKACDAKLWRGEASKGRKEALSKKNAFSLCCMNGKVELPKLKQPPHMLSQLYNGRSERSKIFIKYIRQFNMMFSFTSMGGKIDNHYNNGRGPYSFRINGQNYHTAGSLLPEEGEIPKFLQLYIYDTEHEVENRLNHHSSTLAKSIKNPNSIEFFIVHELKGLLDEINPLVKKFRMVRDRFNLNENENIRLKLIGKREKDGRTYNLPTANEVAALIIGDIDGSADKRDIVLQTKSGKLQRISELHPSYLALQYPLLNPYAEDGYRTDILLRGIVDGTEQGRTTLSMREFFAYRIQQRETEESLMLKSRRLFQQFLVDDYTMVENERLNYIRYHQKELRIAPVNSLSKALDDGESNASSMGNRVILPSSFTGGTRYMQQNYLDAMTLCKFFGYPDLFITMTCNPKWPEICRFLEEHGLNAEDRPDVLSRLFKLKLDHLIKNLKEKRILGRVNAVVYTVEFQKRGLPHAHVCLFLHKDDKLPNPEDIDRVISTEIPQEDEDAELYQLVSEFMMHGPCGKDDPSCPCMINKKCSKRFPKDFTDTTYIDDDGFPVYRRRDNGSTIKKSGVDLDNRSVVGYNAKLLKQYQAHINVEWCNQLGSIKYLFKYINKGPDRICAKFSRPKNDTTDQQCNQQKNVDEIEKYYDCRYISACEAAWRLFKFNVHYQTPHVERLSFHLPGQQPIVYDENDSVDNIVTKPSVGQSQFIKWMECNKNDENARKLTYADFPTEYVWNIQQRKWTRRQGTTAVGRINYVPPKAGEAYYLRILLNKVKGPTCYEDIRTVNEKVYDTYRDACYALGLMDDDKEYIECINETSSWATGAYCRSLFAMLITSDSLSRPEYVWEETWDKLSDDILHIQRQDLNMPDLPHDPVVEKNIALAKIELLLLASGMSLKNIPNMPYPDYNHIKEAGNVMIQEEQNYDVKQLKIDHENWYKIMTDEQKGVYNKIMNAVNNNNQGSVFFLYGYGGTGKTFVWKTLSAGIRSKGEIVINVASSGIAALLLTGGRTAHSRFKLPINPDELSFCSITPDSDLAGLLKKAKLIIWDEAPMTHKHCFEALDRTLKDILRNDKPFGGKVIVFGGDFRQILPVVQKGSRHDIVNATINHSHIWDHCTVLNLTVNMRLKTNAANGVESETKRFAEWILEIGEGTVGEPNDGETDVEFPQDVLISSAGDHMDAIVSCIYPSINEHINNKGYFEDKAILAPTNEEVDSLNDFMLSKIIEDEKTYYSSDTVCETEITDKFEQTLYSPEILNGVKASGIPNHKLTLKKGVPVMLLRNIDQSNGLCNGTRLQIKRLSEHVIEAMIISGSNIGDITYIPRMKLMPSDKTIPFKFNRRQYPLSVCFAMTINKSQGQSLQTVGLYLRRPVFSHGQLYVAVSRVKSKKGIKVLLCDKDGKQTNMTKNVVYKEVLQKL